MWEKPSVSTFKDPHVTPKYRKIEKLLTNADFGGFNIKLFLLSEMSLRKNHWTEKSGARYLAMG